MAQKNRLKYILLGLLKGHPQTGYDLTKSFESDIGEFWSANHSQIYPLLSRMEDDELISHTLVQVGEKLTKKLYDLTETGSKVFEEWLREPSGLDTAHDEFLLKLYFVNDRDSELLQTMVAEQIGLHRDKLALLNSQLAEKFPTEGRQFSAYGHYQLLRHAILREQDYLEWLREI